MQTNPGPIVIAEARRLFNLDVWDPPARDHRPIADQWRAVIGSLISSSAGLGWTWEGAYAGDGDFEWCGAFAAACWGKAGLPLEVRRAFWASCYRLHRWATYRPIDERTPNPAPAAGVARRLCVALDESSTSLPAGVTPQDGDVLIVGSVGSGPGKHVTLVRSFNGIEFLTYEGNGSGAGPDGRHRQGIVEGRRPLGLSRNVSPATYHARWLIRPAPADLVAG